MSTCTRRVALIAKERNIPYEVVVVDFSKGEHKQPGYLQRQPFGQVPYIRVSCCFSVRTFTPVVLFPLFYAVSVVGNLLILFLSDF